MSSLLRMIWLVPLLIGIVIGADKQNLDLPYSAPLPVSTGMTRLVLYEYALHSKTVIHDPRFPEEIGILQEIKARYHYEILHHDLNGHMLTRYQMIECITGPCHNVPDFYTHIIQGGQNLLGAFVSYDNTTTKLDWGVTSALAYSIASPAEGGMGDEQTVIMPHGRCRQYFGRPEDKTFTRKIDRCDFSEGRNHTLLSGLLNLEYQQFVEYKQNKKIDADIVFTEADEQFLIQSPLDERLVLRVNSHLSLEMMNRTLRVMKRYCASDILADECAKQIFNATILGKNWIDVNKKLASLASPFQNRLAEFLDNEQNKLKTCTKPQECFELFKLLSNVIRVSTTEEIENELERRKHDASLILLLHAIAASGSPTSWKKAIEVAKVNGGQHLAQSFIDSLAFTTHAPTTAIKAIKKELMNDEELQFYSTLGYLIKRHCQGSPSHQNACNLGKDSYFNILLNNELKATLDELSQALWHINYKSTADFFKQFVCSLKHESHLTDRALSFYEKLNSHLFDREINNKLLNIFRNTCPQPSTTHQSVSAMNTLVRIAPDFQTIGSFILRGESNNPTNHNLWSQFYERVKQITSNGAYKHDNYWRTLRDLKLFRPNYLQRSLDQDSSSFSLNFQDTAQPLTLTGELLPSESYLETHLSLKNNVSLLKLEIHNDQSSVHILGHPMESHDLDQSIFLYDFAQPIRLISGLTLDLQMSVMFGAKNYGKMNKASFGQGFDVSISASIGNVEEIYGKNEYVLTVSGDVSSTVLHKSCAYLSFDNFQRHLRYIQSSSSKKNDNTNIENDAYPGSSLNLGSFVNHQCHSVL